MHKGTHCRTLWIEYWVMQFAVNEIEMFLLRVAQWKGFGGSIIVVINTRMRDPGLCSQRREHVINQSELQKDRARRTAIESHSQTFHPWALGRWMDAAEANGGAGEDRHVCVYVELNQNTPIMVAFNLISVTWPQSQTNSSVFSSLPRRFLILAFAFAFSSRAHRVQLSLRSTMPCWLFDFHIFLSAERNATTESEADGLFAERKLWFSTTIESPI